jgi:predicted permease
VLLRRPGVALAAVLSLAIGIGANTAIFSVLHSVVINPLEYGNPDGLVVVWETSADNDERWVAPANFVDWRTESRAFASLAAFDEFRPTLTSATEPEVLRAVSASGSFFTTLGVSAATGRTLLPADDDPGAEPVAVLSEGLWQRAFGGASDVVGRTIAIDRQPHTIVGVMPARFESPLRSSNIDVWVNGDRGVPRTFPFQGDLTAVRDSHLIFVIGRLAPGVSRDAAQQELTTLMQELSRRYPSTNAGLGVNVKSLHEQVVGDVRRLVTLLQLAVGMMLLIACANVAHLLLGQAAGRVSEMSTRMALGAARGRLVRQVLAETLVLAVPGGVLGIVLAAWGLEALTAARPEALPRVDGIRLDASVLAFTCGVTLSTAFIFGLGPAIQLARHASLQGHSERRTTAARSVRRWHHAIVIGELAVAQVLLLAAGLLLASFLAAQRVALGFEPDGRVAADLTLSAERYLRPIKEGERSVDITPKLQFVTSVLERVRNAPGVHAAAASFTSPLTGAPNRGISFEGRPPRGPGLEDTADFQVVTTDFFRAVGATLITGRDFSERDTANAPPVAVVNETFVRKYFSTTNPIGQRVRFGGDLAHEIVGVVADMRYRSVESPADPTFYLPIGQNAERWPFLSFTLWSQGDASAAITLLRAAVRAADPQQALMRVRSYDEVVNGALAPRRFNTLLIAAFAAAALLLAAVGTFGVMSYAVSVRARELGVRAALGANPGDLLRLLLRQGATITAAAVALGVIGGLMTTNALTALLYDIAPRDPRTFAAVSASLAVIGLLATWWPARRAVRRDPTLALRDE